MKRILLLIGPVLILAVSLMTFGCAKAPPAELPKTVVISSMPAGMMTHAQAAGIAALISEKTSIQCKHVPLTSEAAFIPMMLTGEVDLGSSNIVEIWMAYMGLPPYDALAKQNNVKSFPVRLIARGDPLIASLFVAGDSGILSVKDLKGRTVANFEAGQPGVHLMNVALLANAGMTYADVKPMPFPSAGVAPKAVIEGRCDASICGIDAPAAKEATAAIKARWLPLDPSPEAVKRLQTANFPGFYLVKGQTRPGMDLPEYLMAWDNCLSVSEGLPDNAAYEIAKALWVYNADLTAKTLLGKWTTDTFVSPLAAVPYHDGAIKFYKEVGAWTKEMETHQKELLAEQPK